MSGINPNYKGCVFCGQEECDCPYTGKETPSNRVCRLCGMEEDPARRIIHADMCGGEFVERPRGAQ